MSPQAKPSTNITARKAFQMSPNAKPCLPMMSPLAKPTNISTRKVFQKCHPKQSLLQISLLGKAFPKCHPRQSLLQILLPGKPSKCHSVQNLLENVTTGKAFNNVTTEERKKIRKYHCRKSLPKMSPQAKRITAGKAF